MFHWVSSMNLHWGRTLGDKWARMMGRQRPENVTYIHDLPFTYNHTEYKITHQRQTLYWEEMLAHANKNSSNTTLRTANNQFLKKSNIFSDSITSAVQSHGFTTVVVIASLFLFITMSITAALVVFCKKRNTVFALQKSEQEDEVDYELDDMNTDIEYTETDFESETESVHVKRKQVLPSSAVGGDSDFENSPMHCPRFPKRSIGEDKRGLYQQMVVRGVMEKEEGGVESEESDQEARIQLQYLKQINKKYYGFTSLTGSDVDSDCELNYPMLQKDKPPTRTIDTQTEPLSPSLANTTPNGAPTPTSEVYNTKPFTDSQTVAAVHKCPKGASPSCVENTNKFANCGVPSKDLQSPSTYHPCGSPPQSTVGTPDCPDGPNSSQKTVNQKVPIPSQSISYHMDTSSGCPSQPPEKQPPKPVTIAMECAPQTEFEDQGKGAAEATYISMNDDCSFGTDTQSLIAS